MVDDRRMIVIKVQIYIYMYIHVYTSNGNRTRACSLMYTCTSKCVIVCTCVYYNSLWFGSVGEVFVSLSLRKHHISRVIQHLSSLCGLMSRIRSHLNLEGLASVFCRAIKMLTYQCESCLLTTVKCSLLCVCRYIHVKVALYTYIVPQHCSC